MSTGKNTGKKFFLMSFIPLLRGDPRLFLNPIDFKPIIEKHQFIGKARACLWARSTDSTILPVFVVDRAKEIRDHLLEWSDNKPADWFKLYMYRTKNKYAIILFPDVARSIARFKFRMALENVDYDDKHDTIEVICQPLMFTSRNLGMIDKIPPTSRMILGLLDTKDVNLKNPPGTDPLDYADPLELGPFEVGDNTAHIGYFNSLLK